MKYVIVTGGVVSGLGKGITASSVGLLLKACGVRVTAIKIDPYLNIDAGTMSPYEHGEVFVLDDGGEVDLDLGNYERFLGVRLTRDHNITTGKVYQRVLNTERRGGYLGKTVQMIPHVSNCIIDWITEVSAIPVDDSNLTPEVCMIELGGTVGDIESMIFLEAIRQLRYRYRKDVCLLHVSLIVSLGSVGELKSKPTQHSMIPLRAAGLLPDCLVLRCCKQVPQTIINKVSIFSMVAIENIMVVPDVNNIYEVPNILLKQNIVQNIFHVLEMNDKNDKNIKINLSKFNYIALQLKTTTAIINKRQSNNNTAANAHVSNFRRKISIGIVGKYTGLMDSYLSVTKALLSASCMCNLELEMVWIESQDLEIYLPSFMKQNDSKEEEELLSDGLSILNVLNADIVHDFSKTFLSKSENKNSEEINFVKSEDDVSNGDCDNNSNSSADIIENADIVHNITVKASPVKLRGKQSLNASKSAWKKLSKVDGILIPGGFGDRGIEGKILAVEYARVHKKPFLGICLGLQLAVVEFCRNVLQMKNANSTEFDAECKYPCVIFMPEGNKVDMGGTMRLGARKCNLKGDSLAQYLYQKEQISERHRHRYEVNPKFVDKIEAHGLRFTGKDVKNERMEIIELPVDVHPFFFGTQFHPEFKSGPLKPSPPFIGLIKASAGILQNEQEFKKEFADVLNN